MAPAVAVYTESEVVKVYLASDWDTKQPVYVHKHPLNGRVLLAGTLHPKDDEAQASHRRKKVRRNAAFSTEAISENRKTFLAGELRNTMKTKHAAHFLLPVNPVALGYLEYFDIIKQPMSLATVETKLASDRYNSVGAFTEDLQLIFNNAAEFHGIHHAITHAGNNMLAHIWESMSKLPASAPTSVRVIKESAQSDLDSTLVTELESHRALVLWSRWLYGSPMWTETDCTDADNDLACLLAIRHHCGHAGGKDIDAMNACSDAIRQLLLSDKHPPSNPLFKLQSQMMHPNGGRLFQMMVEILVHGSCASQGRTRVWLQSIEGKYPEFFRALSHEFAKKVMGEAPPDLMARCAYHLHPTGQKCGDAA